MIEGGHSKNCRYFKTMCIDEPAIAHRLLEKLSEAICVYASHQVIVYNFLITDSFNPHMISST